MGNMVTGIGSLLSYGSIALGHRLFCRLVLERKEEGNPRPGAFEGPERETYGHQLADPSQKFARWYPDKKTIGKANNRLPCPVAMWCLISVLQTSGK
jgi:hypothetical protein